MLLLAVATVLLALTGCDGTAAGNPGAPAFAPKIRIDGAEVDRPADLEAAFVLLDRNGNGRVDVVEMRRGFLILDRNGDWLIEEYEAPGLFTGLDRDGDGTLAPLEFSRLDARAFAGDADGDGRLNLVEFTRR